MLFVTRIADRRVLGGLLVTTLCGLVVLTLAGPVPDATAAPATCGTPGADGPQPTLGGIVNTYFPGASPSVTAGATSLAVGASSGNSTPIAAGDKLLIIQMQSADLDSTNTDAYGDGIAGEPPSGATSWASVGVYEFAVAANNVSSAGGTLQLTSGTLSTYVSSAATASTGQQTFQVVRVPQYSSATLGSNVTATPWNGATGGIVALDVAGTLDLNGFHIDVSTTGFRGGAGRPLSGEPGGSSTDVRTSGASAFNGGKAEGVAGTPRYVFDGTTTTDTGIEGYPNGSFARGAPANAGGGGTDGNPSANDQNSGGGGGANGGAGGQGGNAWSSNLAVGGAGGVAAPAPSVTKVVLGGGGGGATRNNAGPSSGGVGAGLVILDVGSLPGTGEIRANGGDGQSAANDGGGGGGAGGSVVVAAASGGLSGLTVSANGGDGGDAWPTQPPGGFPGERHGPGGGGGGGFVLLSTSGATTTTNGGAHGVTTTASDAYNATDGSGGSTGTFVGPLPGVGNASACSPQLTVTKLTSTPSVTNTPAGTAATYTIAVANAPGRDTARQVALTDVLPTGFTYASTGAVTLDSGATRAVAVNPVAGVAVPSWSEFTIPGGASVSLTFTVAVASSVSSSTVQNPALATYLDPARTTANGTVTASYDPSSSTAEDVQITWPDLTIAKSHSGSFARGGSHTYSLTVTNSGDAVSSGSVVLTDVLPAGLTPTLAQGTGWTCGIGVQTVTCSRSDGLPPGLTYPAVTVTVAVAQSAPGSVTNTATIAGGSEQVTGNNSASDPTAIVDHRRPVDHEGLVAVLVHPGGSDHVRDRHRQQRARRRHGSGRHGHPARRRHVCNLDVCRRRERRLLRGGIRQRRHRDHGRSDVGNVRHPDHHRDGCERNGGSDLQHRNRHTPGRSDRPDSGEQQRDGYESDAADRRSGRHEDVCAGSVRPRRADRLHGHRDEQRADRRDRSRFRRHRALAGHRRFVDMRCRRVGRVRKLRRLGQQHLDHARPRHRSDRHLFDQRHR